MTTTSHKAGGTYRPVPELPDDLNTVGAQIQQAAAMCRTRSARYGSPEVLRRNRLMAYASRRGASIRQLSDLTGLASTSTVFRAIERVNTEDLGVLADECPEDLR